MTGPQHYQEAERLLVHVDRSIQDQFGDGAECARQELAAAQVHATLALAAAAGLNDNPNGMPSPDWKAWREVAATPTPEA
jgi:hypothetical protein